jgi:glutamine amidotransferase-like protein
MSVDPLILPSCPKGIFGTVISDEDNLSPGALFSARKLNSNEHVLQMESGDGQAVIGAVYGERGPESLINSGADENAQIGITIGMFFSDSILGKSPHLVPDLASSILPHCNGMFSTAAYADGILYLISDPLGSYPIYYSSNDRGFVFSSSIKELHQSSIVNTSEYNEGAVSQYLCLGKLISGESVWKDIHKLDGATIYEYDIRSKRLQKHRYWYPKFDRDKSPEAIEAASRAFIQAVHRSVSAGTGNTVAAITGGLDSRLTWAVLKSENLLDTAVTHYMEDGHDAIIAAAISETMGIKQKVVHVDKRYTTRFDDNLHSFLASTNGMIPADNAHLPFMYAQHKPYADSIIDGINTNLERTIGLREQVQEFDSADAVSGAIGNAMILRGMYDLLEDDTRQNLKNNCLETIRQNYDNTPNHLTAKERCDAFFLQFVVPHYATDTVLLQNHYNLFITPFYDLDYIDALTRIHHKYRSRYILQRSILKKTNPTLWSIPRSYADIKTLAVSNPRLQIMPLAWDRIIAPRISKFVPRKRRPSLYLRNVSMNYADIFRNYVCENRVLMIENIAPYLSQEKLDRFMLDYLNNQNHDDGTMAKIITMCTPHSVFQTHIH